MPRSPLTTVPALRQPPSLSRNRPIFGAFLGEVTPLPWRAAELDNGNAIPVTTIIGNRRSGRSNEIVIGRINSGADARYLCHAANTLPNTVAALRLLFLDQRHPKSELSREQLDFCEAALVLAENPQPE